jgi:Mrp family chromosome partitioning ATPase
LSKKEGTVMSKNYELLRNLGKEQDFLKNLPANGDGGPPSPPATGAMPGLTSNLAQPGLEQINALVQQVFLAPGGDAPRAVVLVSTEAGTGCTWVTAHVAELLASRVAGAVCVIDANLRDPALHTQFGVDNSVGLSDALLQLEPIRTFARPLSLPNFFMISAGSSDASAQSLITSDRMRLRITELRSEFDFILFDTCSLSVANDAIGLGSFCDGVLMVLKANASRKESARQAIQDLQGGNAKVLGAVLNQRNFPIPENIYKKF